MFVIFFFILFHFNLFSIKGYLFRGFAQKNKNAQPCQNMNVHLCSYLFTVALQYCDVFQYLWWKFALFILNHTIKLVQLPGVLFGITQIH